MSDSAYGVPLADGIRSRFVDNANGLRMHVLEAGHETPDRPLALLLHGFPELAFSWRKVMPALAQAGWHVLAPDQRGYGRTSGWDDDYDGDLSAFRLTNLVRDTLGLVFALGHRRVDALVGHDFGAILAPWCVLMRPDVFRALAVMSAPFAGPPRIPVGEHAPSPASDIHEELAALDPPRKHYHWYYSTRPANADMLGCEQGVHDFLRAYYHMKSADWVHNRPHGLASWSAGELAKLPTYYVMERDRDMARTVAPEMPTDAQVAACQWLTDEELQVYSGEFARTGFQGGLNWYRGRTCGRYEAELQIFDGCSIDVPACFIAGASDWGALQSPGALEKMRDQVCTDMRGCDLLDGAGHWVQQEQPDAVNRLLIDFFSGL